MGEPEQVEPPKAIEAKPEEPKNPKVFTFAESEKLWFEVFKHLSTFNVACLVILSGVLERGAAKFNKDEMQMLLLPFALSLIGCLMAMVSIPHQRKKRSRVETVLWIGFILTAITGFLGGLTYVYYVMMK